MDIGFYHPSMGYWQGIDVSTEPYTIIEEPAIMDLDEEGNEIEVVPAVTRETSQLEELLSSYPQGTIQVPLKPSANHEWVNGEWVLQPIDTEAERTRLQALIDLERDRRIANGFMFNDKLYQSRPEDRENITGASIAALAAIGMGAEVGDLRWHGGDSDFEWIAADNSLTAMDAHTVFLFGQTAMAHKQTLIFAARYLKDAEDIPLDYEDDVWWP